MKSLLSKTHPLLTKTCFHVLCPQEEFTASVENIQEFDRIHIDQDDEETCVSFYVDVIQACGFFRLFFLKKAGLITATITEVCQS